MVDVAVILVGGLGSRLQAMVPDLPKPLAPVLGRPFLEYLLSEIAAQGIKKVLLLCAYKPEEFNKFPSIGDQYGLQIEIIVEEKALGTGGALKNAESALGQAESFLFLNGDTFFRCDWKNLLSPLKAGSVGRMGLMHASEVSRFGTVEVNDSHFVSAFLEKSKTGPGWVNCGMSVLSQKIFQLIPSNRVVSLEQEILPKTEKLEAVRLTGRFYDIGTPQSYCEFVSDCAFRKLGNDSELAPLILITWLSGGRILIDEKLEVGKTEISGLEIEFFKTENLKHLLTLSEKDLVISRTELSGMIARNWVTKKTELLSALNIFVKMKTELQSIKGRFSLWGQEWRPGLFLDRDGVVIDFVDYISDWRQVKLMKGVEKLIEKAHQRSWAVSVITNQSGIGRGFYDWPDFDRVQQEMMKLLAQGNQFIDDVIFAPFYEKSLLTRGWLNSSFRKPNPAGVLSSAQKLRVDLSQSIFVGDSASDVEAAVRAGIRNVYFLKGERTTDELKKMNPEFKFKTIQSLSEVDF